MVDNLGQINSNKAFANFCSICSDPRRHNPSATFCSHVLQLALFADGETMQYSLMLLYGAKRRRALAADRLDDNDAEQLLHQFLEAYPHTTLVLDALDKCNACAHMPIVNLLEGLVHAAAGVVTIFGCSRLYRGRCEALQERDKRRHHGHRECL
jgi:hypothetical protein